ncbi:hypothetical protein NicSoilB8_22960 [Arthrobacter sp. NicSoilB8]|nr:hypothetical protein NicSoilB8_22960 [Arthrobacter sp. NicSoilB8]
MLLLGPVGRDPEGRQDGLERAGCYGALHSVPAPVTRAYPMGSGKLTQERVCRISGPGVTGLSGVAGGLVVRAVRHAPTLDGGPAPRPVLMDVRFTD